MLHVGHFIILKGGYLGVLEGKGYQSTKWLATSVYVVYYQMLSQHLEFRVSPRV